MPDWPRFVELVRTHERFLITSHVRPDGDAVGSEVAMAAVLQQLGKQVLVVNPHPTPPRLQFLDPHQRLKLWGLDVTAEQCAEYQVLMILDAACWPQLGEMAEVVRRFEGLKLVLDHHVSHDDLGAESFADSAAEATGRLVVEAADHLGVSLTAEMARALLAALATDTGWFRFCSTSGRTLQLAARLLDVGVRPEELYRQLFEDEHLGRLQLIGRALSRAQAELGGRLIYSHLLQEDFRATGAHSSDSEQIVNMILAVQGAEAATLFVEQPDGGFKISLRSRCDLDCARLAEQFGGGGHRKAAGAYLNRPLAMARTTVVDAIRRAMP